MPPPLLLSESRHRPVRTTRLFGAGRLKRVPWCRAHLRQSGSRRRRPRAARLTGCVRTHNRACDVERNSIDHAPLTLIAGVRLTLPMGARRSSLDRCCRSDHDCRTASVSFVVSSEVRHAGQRTPLSRAGRGVQRIALNAGHVDLAICPHPHPCRPLRCQDRCALLCFAPRPGRRQLRFLGRSHRIRSPGRNF